MGPAHPHIKSYKPFFEIVFHIEDLVLAFTLQSLLVGNIYIKGNYCVLVIKKKSSVLFVISLIKGYMISPKIEALHRMIELFNTPNKCQIKPLGIDMSPLNSNGWLSGMIDADGSFYFNCLTGKKGLPNLPQYYMRIS